MMQAKMKVHSVTLHEGGEKLLMSVVTEEHPVATVPSPFAGQVEMTITNPKLLGTFKPGQTYYVDFTSADPSAIIT